MTMNIAAAVWNTFVFAFVVLVAIGVAMGVYAAKALKKAETKEDDGA